MQFKFKQIHHIICKLFADDLAVLFGLPVGFGPFVVIGFPVGVGSPEV